MIKSEKSPKFWSKVIEGYESSGLSKADYCKTQKVSANKFYYWCAKLRPDLKSPQHMSVSNKSEFIPIQTTKTASSSFSIRLKSGMELKFDSLPDPIWIANLLNLAAGLNAEH